MKTTALHQNFYSVYQTFKTYKELDQINTYNTALVIFGVCRKPKMTCPHSGMPDNRMVTSLIRPPITLESMWQLALASGLESLACYPQGQGRRARKILLDLFSLCSFQKLYQNL